MTRGTTPDPTTPSVVILGTDAVLAARPATPVQLAHACLALGFDMAVPASWGDELVAEACVTRAAARGAEPAILCTCPFVRERLTRSGTELVPHMIALVSPPVAAARYVRAAAGARTVHITYAGRCPGASDAAIDARIEPRQLLSQFVQHGIAIADQPETFESVLPADRRRFYSLPGGAPFSASLQAASRHTLRELSGDDALLALAQSLLARDPVVLDMAPRLGCACSGAPPLGAADVRDAVVALEPPRALKPVLDPAVRVAVDLDPSTVRDTVTVAARSQALDVAVPHSMPTLSGSVRRLLGRGAPSPPILRTRDGRAVPRAFALASRLRQSAERRRETSHRRSPPVDVELRIDRSVEVDDPPRHRRGIGPSVHPISGDPPRVVPPPPARPKPRNVLGLLLLLSFALAQGSRPHRHFGMAARSALPLHPQVTRGSAPV